MKRLKRAFVFCLALSVLTSPLIAQEEERTFEHRLVAFTNQLRMGLTLATVATHSPTLRDLQLHAQQLVNLLEGSEGRHFSRPAGSENVPIEGMANAIQEWNDRFAEADIAPPLRSTLSMSARNVKTYLELALDAALASLQKQRLDLASGDMLRAYAFLLAAYEKPCDTNYIPALWTILRAFGVEEASGSSGDE